MPQGNFFFSKVLFYLCSSVIQHTEIDDPPKVVRCVQHSLGDPRIRAGLLMNYDLCITVASELITQQIGQFGFTEKQFAVFNV